MKLLIPILLLCFFGCAMAPRKAAVFGRGTARNGTVLLAATGAFPPFTLPLCIVSLPFFAVGVPLYYGGNALSGEPNESHPFEL